MLGPITRTTLTTATNLATAILRTGELAEAEALLRDVIARRERTLGADDTATLLARENLATVLVVGGRVDEALVSAKPRSPCAARATGSATRARSSRGCISRSSALGMSRLADPVPTFEKLLEEMRAVFGERHHCTGEAMLGLAAALEHSGRPEDALGMYEKTIELYTAVLGPSQRERSMRRARPSSSCSASA